jgi:hypothetical protein
MACLRDQFQNRTFSFCSIGCGCGGEESLLAGSAEPMALIEPDERQNRFHHANFPPGVRIEKSYFQFCSFPQPFDVVYAASLGSWMTADPFAGMDPELLRFLQKSLKPRGLGIFLVYGGNHSAFILDKETYLSRLRETANAAGFQILLYGKYHSRGALLIVSVGPASVTGFAGRLLPGEIYIRDNELTGTPRRAAWTAYPATLAVATHALRKNLGKSLGDFVASFRTVAALRRRH